MQPFHQLLDRMRWDRNFGDAEFEIGYYDRVEDRIIRIALDLADAGSENIAITDAEEREVKVPHHRVRRVWRDGQLIWTRDP